jgi:hypothetical protein
LWHLFEQVNRHSIGRVKANPQTVKGNKGIVSEPAATFRGGGFVSIANNALKIGTVSLVKWETWVMNS